MSLFISLSVMGWAFRDRAIGRFKLLLIPFYYCLANGAALVAIFKLLRGERIERWRPQRLQEVDALSSPLESVTEWRLGKGKEGKQ